MECGRRFKNAYEFQKNYSGAYKRVLREGGKELLRELYPNMRKVLTKLEYGDKLSQWM